ncbi:MAG: ATP-binding protein [Myxococcota bacterium]|nr:ATP-binding protein [Myxococcota bacterium]
MQLVSSHFLEDFFQAAESAGVERSRLLDGFPPEAALSSATAHPITWEEFATILERLEDAVLGPDGLERIGSRITNAKPMPVLRRLAGLSARPTTLYRAAQNWALRRALPGLQSSIVTLEDDRLRVECTVPAPLRPCPQIFHLATGALRALPRALDLGEAYVQAEISERHAEWRILLPPARTLGARLTRARRAFFSSRAALDQLTSQQAELEARIDDLQSANSALRASKNRMRARAEASADPILELDSVGTIRYLSPSVRSVTGYLPVQLRGTLLSGWLHPGDEREIATDLERLFKDRTPKRLVARLRHRKGHWIWVEFSTSLFQDTGNKETAIVSLRDISRNNSSLPEASLGEHIASSWAETRERLAEVPGATAAGEIAHAINNPLTALTGNVQMMIEDGEGPEFKLKRVLRLAERIRSLVSETLDLYRVGTLHRSTVSVGQLLRDLRHELSDRVDPETSWIHVADIEDTTSICGDRTLLGSALAAVADNAFDAVARDPRGWVRLSVENGIEENTVIFRVADNGPGIPPELRLRVLEPRFTTKSCGTGIGLAFARTVVEAHGGRIGIHQSDEGGALVTVEIPSD